MGIGEAIEAVRQFGAVRVDGDRLLIEVDRRHLGTLAAHIEVLKRCKAQAVAMLEAEASQPSQSAIDAAVEYLNGTGAGIQKFGGVLVCLLPAGADVPAARRALAVLGMGDAVIWLA